MNTTYIIYRLQTSLRQHKQAQPSRANATNENTGETNQANENDDGQLKSKNIYNRGCNKRNKHRKRSQARRRTVHNALQHRTRRCNKGCRTGQSATQVIAYADEIALITGDKKSMEAALQKLVTETE
jgi:hypothetical protein